MRSLWALLVASSLIACSSGSTNDSDPDAGLGSVEQAVCTNCRTGATCSIDICDYSLGEICCANKCTTLSCTGGSCTSGADCASGHCSGGDHVCCPVGCAGNCAGGTCKNPNGSTCSSASSCISGNCTDGYCCSSASCGICGVCNATGNCVAVAPNPVASHGTCPIDNPTNPCSQHQCNGSTTSICASYVSGTACAAAGCTQDSATGYWSYQTAGTCKGDGTCSTSPVSCGVYGCGASGCKASCTTAADCGGLGEFACNASGKCVSSGKKGSACSATSPCGTGLNCVEGYCCDSAGMAACMAGYTCAGPLAASIGTCKKAKGQTCALNDDCGSGFCIDGLCCDSKCDGQCQACDVAGKLGTCSNVSGDPHGTRAKCSTVATDAACAARCDGFTPDKCVYPVASTSCGTKTCTGGTETHLSSCDGKGNCGDTPSACGHYKCGASACLTSCASVADCASGYTCDSKGQCVDIAGLGNPCDPTGASTCATGTSCVATSPGASTGYCCDKSPTECDPTKGFSCALVGFEGHCLKKQGATCGADSECGSAMCVDGVCCDARCDGQCEACDVVGASGNKGTCTPVTGKPHGMRAACEAPAGEPCKSAACSGKETDTKSCTAFVGSETSCIEASCADGKLTPSATCDGKGGCATSTPVDCGGFTCDAAGKACKTSCTADTDCKTGFVCDPKGGKCVRINAHCEGDVSVANDTGDKQDCAPYHCQPNGSCGTTCASSSDCQVGVCDTSSSQCVADSGGTGDSGGCTYGARPVGLSALALALVGLAAGRRRRVSGGGS
jgi:hypothetical protein